MPTSVHLSGVAASYGARPLFSGLDLRVADGDVVALVGRNGSGKSTLLRMVAGLHPVERGSITTSPPMASVGHLPQELPHPEESIRDYVGRRTGVRAAEHRYLAAADELAAGAPGAEDRYAQALDRWLGLGGADVDARLAEELSRLGLAADLARPLGALSGGQAARVALASILVSRFDVLLLDEPTNNLDDEGLAALTGFVGSVPGPVVVASHDRAFMDAVATNMCELDLDQQRVAVRSGGWSDHVAAKQLEVRHRQEATAAYEQQRDALLAQARRQDEWARRGRVAIARQARDARTPRIDRSWAEDKARKQDQKAARARSAVERLVEPEPLRKQWQLQYAISEAPESADVVLTLDEVTATAGHFHVGPVTTHVARGDRVALVGANGSGKSTLLRAVLASAADSGRISWGSRTTVGVVDQDRSRIAGDTSLLGRVMAELGATDAAATRTLLAKFGLGAEHIGRPCDTLSLGERTRAALAVLQARAVNVLVLDEPTNHADVEAIEQLQQALVGFGGTVLLVTHDHTLRQALGATMEWRFTRHGDRALVDVVSLSGGR